MVQAPSSERGGARRTDQSVMRHMPPFFSLA